VLLVWRARATSRDLAVRAAVAGAATGAHVDIGEPPPRHRGPAAVKGVDAVDQEKGRTISKEDEP
jgi:hypothetical protein